MAEPRALTVSQFMAATGLSRSTVYRRITDGTLKAVRFGGTRYLIPVTELLRITDEETEK
jgi:excisionase family DNA binding protein